MLAPQSDNLELAVATAAQRDHRQVVQQVAPAAAAADMQVELVVYKRQMQVSPVVAALDTLAVLPAVQRSNLASQDF